MTTPLVLIDMSNLCFRSHFAFKGLTYEDQPTGALYGTLNAVLNLRKQFGDRLVFCWDYGLPGDKPKPNWRKAIFPEYKANRKHEEKDIQGMYATLPRLREALDGLGYWNFGLPGLEADDLIGILSSQESAFIVSSDQDLYQLLEGLKVLIVHPKKGDGGYVTLSQNVVEAKHGISISKWPHYLALGGDKSDCIKAMPGVGPKTALKMVHFGALPYLEWQRQPLLFQQKFPRAGGCWDKVMAAYQVALIPRELGDPRIRGCVNGYKLPFASYGRENGDSNKKLNAISGFCADFGLMQHLSQRKEFL